MNAPQSLGTVLVPLALVACTDLWEPDRVPVEASGGELVLQLKWDLAETAGEAISRIPLLSRIRLVVDYPENHGAEPVVVHTLIDADLPLDGQDQVLDVAAGPDRVFQVAAYQAGQGHPTFFGAATATVEDRAETAEPQVVEITIHPLLDDADHPPVVGLSAAPESLAGNTVEVTAQAADLDLDAITLAWLVTRGVDELEPVSVDAGVLEFRPPWPGLYQVQLVGTAAEVESEPAYIAVVVHRCDDGVPELECDEGLECEEDGTCRGPDDRDWPDRFDDTDGEGS